MEQTLNFQTYNNALKKNKLLGLRCAGCDTITCPPKMTCQECAETDLSVVEMIGTVKIVTFTTTYVAPMGREVEAPYTIVMVELDEGRWIAGNLAGIDPVEADMGLIGRRVRFGYKVFPGDRYSASEAARPLFSLMD